MRLLILGIICFSISKISAQDNKNITSVPNSAETYNDIHLKQNPFLLPISKTSIRGSYPLEISYIKTTHIIFPARIIDFDAGSDVVIATVPDQVQNLIRIKSDVKGFYQETNMTVVTEDGGLYSFLIRYNEDPDVFTINISNNVAADDISTSDLGIGLSSNSSPNVYILGDGEYNHLEVKNNCLTISDSRNFIKHIGAKKEGIRAQLKGVHKDENLLYLKIHLANKSYMPYTLDFIKVFIRDKNQVKRTAVQEEELRIIAAYPMDHAQMPFTADFTKVVAIPLMTVSDGKIVEIEMYEKRGGRHIKFQVDNDTLLRVKNL